MKKTGISQKAVVFNAKGHILAIRRSGAHPFLPFVWDLPGGDLDFGENPQEGIRREIKEETGLIVAELAPFDVYSSLIDKKDKFWVTIVYRARAASEIIQLSYEHDEFRWVAPEEFLRLKSSEKLKQFVKNFLKLKQR